MRLADKRERALTWQRTLSLRAPTSDHHWRAVNELWPWLAPLGLRNALEIGCGEPPYLLLRLLRDKGLEVNGYDGLADPQADPSVIGTVAQGDVHDLPWAGGSFDLVCARHVLEHVLSPYEVVMEMMRVGRGLLLIVVPWNSDKAGNWPDHLWRMERNGWERMWQMLGLQVVEFAEGNHTEEGAPWDDREWRYLLRYG